MKARAETAALYVGGAALLLVGFWIWRRGVGGAAYDATKAAVNAATGAAAGVVVGAGQVVGIPATDQTQCQKDIAAGNTLAASASCPAGDFMAYLWNGGSGVQATQ